MKKEILCFVLLVMSHLYPCAQVQHLKDKNEASALSEQVVKMFEANQIEQAVDIMEPYWPLPQNEIESFEKQTIDYLNLINERFGKSIGSLKIKTEKINDFALRETYLLRYEYIAIRLLFTYYKNASGWIVNFARILTPI